MKKWVSSKHLYKCCLPFVFLLWISKSLFQKYSLSKIRLSLKARNIFKAKVKREDQTGRNSREQLKVNSWSLIPKALTSDSEFGGLEQSAMMTLHFSALDLRSERCVMVPWSSTLHHTRGSGTSKLLQSKTEMWNVGLDRAKSGWIFLSWDWGHKQIRRYDGRC